MQRRDALTAIEILRRRSIPIFGGDVYFVRGDRTALAHAGWHCDPRDEETAADYLARSCHDAQKYIAAFPYCDGAAPVFALVIQPAHLVALIERGLAGPAPTEELRVTWGSPRLSSSLATSTWASIFQTEIVAPAASTWA